jgi:hypothetical protein
MGLLESRVTQILMMWARMVPEMSVIFNQLTRLIARDYIQFNLSGSSGFS